MDTWLYQQLSSDPTLTGLVSDRITPIPPPYDFTEENAAWVGYMRTATEPQVTFSGPCDLVKYEYEVQFWSLVESEAQAIGEAIKGVLGSVLNDGTVQACYGPVNAFKIESDLGFHYSHTFIVWG